MDNIKTSLRHRMYFLSITPVHQSHWSWQTSPHSDDALTACNATALHVICATPRLPLRGDINFKRQHNDDLHTWSIWPGDISIYENVSLLIPLLSILTLQYATVWSGDTNCCIILFVSLLRLFTGYTMLCLRLRIKRRCILLNKRERLTASRQNYSIRYKYNPV